MPIYHPRSSPAEVSQTVPAYSQLSEEGIFLNSIGAMMIAVAVVVPVIKHCLPGGRGGWGGNRVEDRGE